MYELDERNYIYSLKVFATISIVAAHCTSIELNSNKLNILFSYILKNLGYIGVGIFFITSGYLFHKNQYSFNIFLRKKIKTIIIPWIFSGTIVYLYVALRKGGINIINWINFIIGNNSYLYFLSLLMLFYIIFFGNCKNMILIYCSIIMSVINIILTASGYLSEINPYLNLFNFIIYFAIGLFISEKDILLEIANKCRYHIKILICAYIILIFLTNILGISSGYWGYATLIIQPIAILVIFGLSTYKKLYNDIILRIGCESFSIYLLHMPIAGIITNIFNKLNWWIITLFRPIIVIIITMIFIYFFKYISNKLNISSKINYLIGVR